MTTFGAIKSGYYFTTGGKKYLKLTLTNPIQMNVALDHGKHEIEGTYNVECDTLKNAVCLDTGKLEAFKDEALVKISWYRFVLRKVVNKVVW